MLVLGGGSPRSEPCLTEGLGHVRESGRAGVDPVRDRGCIAPPVDEAQPHRTSARESSVSRRAHLDDVGSLARAEAVEGASPTRPPIFPGPRRCFHRRCTISAETAAAAAGVAYNLHSARDLARQLTDLAALTHAHSQKYNLG